MRVKDNTLHFAPKIPKEWEGYSFKINFRNQIVKVTINQKATQIALEGNTAITVVVNGKEVAVAANGLVTV
jgi:maltose phosphorylase